VSKPCELSLLDHWNDIADVLLRAGIGLKCETAWHALLIIAETAKILNNHPDYDPVPEALKLAMLAREHQARLLAERLKQSAEVVFDTMSTPVDKNKVN